MPYTMPKTFDARPDRIDFRDRIYQPQLVSLPEQFPSKKKIENDFGKYSECELILNQGNEGACTGFGLAAMINFLQFSRNSKCKSVSPRMLYHLARFYDEWDGEDYEGSSCRGAMKGWHRHGACLEKLWPYKSDNFIEPKPEWRKDAAKRPLGAYYRVNHLSIIDMQSAVYETGAIYVSATIHTGWQIEEKNFKKLPVINYSTPDPLGGHAFCIVGYTEDGFIVQNSWGTDWGYHGFALLSYSDWAENGNDAWVAVMGAPMKASVSPAIFSDRPLEESMRAEAWWNPLSWGKDPYEDVNEKVRPISKTQALHHTIVLGNNGTPLNRLPNLADAKAYINKVCYMNAKKWLQDNNSGKVVIYAHGGLNSESASIKRIRIMAPYFIANGIYPIFVTWKSGVLESLGGMLGDIFKGEEPKSTFFNSFLDTISDKKDRTIELTLGKMGKSLWTEMKQNCRSAAKPNGGLRILDEYLNKLKADLPNLEIHLMGHSAGSILHGHLLSLMKGSGLQASTCTLFAPACTVEFANEFYQQAIYSNTLQPDDLHLEILNDVREREDTLIKIYGKSLLYMISRALEDVHKTPILGMHRVWNGNNDWSNLGKSDVSEWGNFVNEKNINSPNIVHDQSTDGVEKLTPTHGYFDNAIDVMTRTLERIKGSGLNYKIENLSGF